MAALTTATALAKFHGAAYGGCKVSVPFTAVNPTSTIPGRVFCHLLDARHIEDELVMGHYYLVTIDVKTRTARLA